MLIVLDTNIALDLLVFGEPTCAPLADALAAGELRWLATGAMRGELARVLGYPAIAARLAAPGRQATDVLADFDRRAWQVDDAPACAACVCRDPDDQMFIDLAVAHRARLGSKDRAVLALRKRLAAWGVTVSARL
jgi:predicted nucleic acid-binding protein